MKVYSLTEAAKFLGKSRQTVTAWRKDGIFPPPDQFVNTKVMFWTEETLVKFKETM